MPPAPAAIESPFQRLIGLLTELFQLDQPDLDFGLYRIMHAKSTEVTQFLTKDLLPQVKAAFAGYQSADTATLQKELADLQATIAHAGMDPRQSPKVRELEARLAGEGVDIAALERDVYDHLFTFFRRYYSEGDFLSKRVYKQGVYAIPYDGEEVALHWANKDQYYIKTSEYLRDYAFRLRPDDVARPMRVHFRLVDAAEGEHGNAKASEGKDRVFILAPGGDDGRDCIAVDGGELSIRFVYRPATTADWPADRPGDKPPKQADLVASAVQRILALGGDNALAEWIAALAAPAPTDKQRERTRLHQHLDRYVKRNTFDYFIHKDLGGFLRRELDFFIKNEVMHLDDIESESAPRVEHYLGKIRIIRRIAGKIIDFLAQLEDFQKKLWLKKKFVVETSWCIRIGCIPESFLPEIAANERQRAEWVTLCAIDTIEAGTVQTGYSVPLTAAFVKEHPTLMVDTRNFTADFTARVLEAVGEIDGQTDGVLLHSENFQALSLMQARYQRQVKCVYIDPPYNTGSDSFSYKDSYRHSSWLTMSVSRLRLSENLLAPLAATFISLDDNEAAHLTMALEPELDRSKHVTNIIWQKVDSPNDNKVPLTPDHEYVLCFSTDATLSHFRPLDDPSILESYRKDPETGKLYRDRLLKKNGANSRRSDRPTMYFPIRAPDGTEVYPKHDNGEDARWALAKTSVMALADSEELVWKRRTIGGVERWEPYTREYAPDIPTRPFPTIWLDVKTMRQAKAQMKDLFSASAVLETVKPTQLIERVQELCGNDNGIVLDFFSGSGTTGHSTINLNREDGGRRKFVLAEMADYFESGLVPRLKKVTFTPNWNDGKPERLATAEEAERSPRLMKVIRLESYEDTLNNLAVTRSDAQQTLLDLPAAAGPDRLREQYLLRYQLDIETRGSASLLTIAAFIDPLAYTLQVKRPGSDESRVVQVDLIETFTWLIGLTVQHLGAPRSFAAAFRRAEDADLPKDAPRRLELAAALRLDLQGKWWFRAITGTLPDGRPVLVIWRNRPGGETPAGMEEDNLVLDAWFAKQGYATLDREFALIYVNGDNNLENQRTAAMTWKVRLIESDFHRLMFAPVASEGV